MIKECFNKLKAELENKGIKHLEIFMNCVFTDLFDKLHNQECINNFEDLIKFEDELEELISMKFKLAKEEINKYKELEKESIKDEKSAIALI
jgi:pyruvate/2-oxoacid:ferredoxin oxidoreductase beta subunit